MGLGVTARHIAGVAFGNKAITVQYPEEQHVPSPNYRGVHRLNKDEQGRVKCVACMLCATACPAHCIDIVGATAPDTWPDREKYPESFVIDELRCIYCGMCEEACPVEAIELTGLYDLTGLSREQMIFDKTKLLSVFDATKDAEPMKYTTPPPGPATQTKMLAVAPGLTRPRCRPRPRRDFARLERSERSAATRNVDRHDHRRRRSSPPWSSCWGGGHLPAAAAPHGTARPRRVHAAGGDRWRAWRCSAS